MEQKALIIGEETVRKHLTIEDVIDICEKTWRWYGEGNVVMPNKITTDTPTTKATLMGGFCCWWR